MKEYPVTVGVEYTERLSRLTTFFRCVMVIPHSICLYFVGIAASVLVFISWWAILFTARYPKWAFEFVSGYLRWYTRVMGYNVLLTDKYPPFSFGGNEMKEYPVTVGVEYTERLSRLTTFFRCVMVIPHFICLYFVGIAAGVLVFISWWAILFTARYPKWAFEFVSGYLRWYTRVIGYNVLLTDKYPPFSFD